MTKLIDGRIPENVPCPFKEKCHANEVCRRTLYIDKSFSCAFARAYDLCEEDTMEVKPTSRGFSRIDFKDDYGNAASLQESSSGVRIWLGVNKPDIKILAPNLRKIKESFIEYINNLERRSEPLGWVDLELPKEFTQFSRMHLNTDDVKKLLPYLINFAMTGHISNDDDNSPYLEKREIITTRLYNPKYGDLKNAFVDIHI
mgnify:FL=1